MAEEGVQRRLTTILAVDVVGYSRLMERDEAGTLSALKVRRKTLLEPLVTKYRGRVFKVTGDGVLVEFASTVNAVQCAVDLQRDMAPPTPNCPPTVTSCCASVSISAMSWSKAAISMATA